MMVAACISRGGNFQQKLDRYFKAHAQEIKTSIEEWDRYNLQDPVYWITERELKDVVLDAYARTLDYLLLSLRHQIEFFKYYTQHMYEGNTVLSLKKRFDSEQIRERTFQELCNMIDVLKKRNISCPKLGQCQQAYSRLKLDPENPKALKAYLQLNIGFDGDEAIAGGRKYYERTEEDMQAIIRMHFFRYYLLEATWTTGLDLAEIGYCFTNGFTCYAKWNPKAWPGWREKQYTIYKERSRWQPSSHIVRPNYGRMNGLIIDEGNSLGTLIVRSYPAYPLGTGTRACRGLCGLI